MFTGCGGYKGMALLCYPITKEAVRFIEHTDTTTMEAAGTQEILEWPWG